MLLQEWNDYFVAQAGAAAALAGLLFVAVSINLERILKFTHLPMRAIEALATLLAVLFVSTWALVPGQSLQSLGLEIGGTGLGLWIVQTIGLVKTRRSGYERAPRLFFNQTPALPFMVAGILVWLGKPSGLYWVVPGVLLCTLSGVYSAWILLVEIQR